MARSLLTPRGWIRGLGIFPFGDRNVVGPPYQRQAAFPIRWRLAVVNATVLDDVEPGPSRQHRTKGFIQRLVRRVDDKPILGHAPFFSAGRHGDVSRACIGPDVALYQGRCCAAKEERLSVSEDQITAVLRECETTLRDLATHGRLPGNALTAFATLAARIREEMERRKERDRRETPRPTADRRKPSDVPEAAGAGDRPIPKLRS